MKYFFVLAGFAALAVGNVQAGEFYRWTDGSGMVHYGDQPPAAEGVRIEQKKFVTTPEMKDAGLPYETRRAQDSFPVTLYTASSCKDVCSQARDFLTQRGVPFKEKNLSTQQERDSFKKESGGDQLPTILVGKTFLKGFEAGQWGGELDTAGYPKTASYHPKSLANPSSDKKSP